MHIQTILNRVEKFKSFAYGKAHWEDVQGDPALVIRVRSRKNVVSIVPAVAAPGVSTTVSRIGGSRSSRCGESSCSWCTGCDV